MRRSGSSPPASAASSAARSRSGSLRLAARDRDQIAEPEADEPKARSSAAVRAALAASLPGSNSRTYTCRPRFGSFSRRSSCSRLTAARRRHLLQRGRAAGAWLGDHPLRILEPLKRRARAACSASARCSGQTPSGDARYRARSALPPARRAQAIAFPRFPTPSASSSSAIRAAGTGRSELPLAPRAIVGRSLHAAHEHDVRERCRLLERLEQRVLRLVVHAIGLDDHEHAALRPRMAEARPGARPACGRRRRARRAHPAARPRRDPDGRRRARVARRRRSEARLAGLRRAAANGRRGLALARPRQAVEEIGVRQARRRASAPSSAMPRLQAGPRFPRGRRSPHCSRATALVPRRAPPRERRPSPAMRRFARNGRAWRSASSS